MNGEQDDTGTSVVHDKASAIVVGATTNLLLDGTGERAHYSLPQPARLPINRCSLPAVLLGSLSYQRNPVPLVLDGVLELHKQLFIALDAMSDPKDRARRFQDHMAAAFTLGHPEEAGWSPHSCHDRSKANYLKVLRGWTFDSDSQEGAVLKGWVESRFGLLPRYHGAPIRDCSGETYRTFLEQRARGLYGTNALEAQLDLLYTYCQYELGRQYLNRTHITLYRGINHLNDHEVLQKLGKRRVVLFNNIASFTTDWERASEFGDTVLVADAPIAKIFFFHRLLPEQLRSEDEYILIGGVYEVNEARFNTL